MDKLGRTFGFYSSGPSRPWLWIIEYLSSFVEIDTCIIRALMEEAPLLPNELDERTRERVALKCLEEIFGFKHELKNVASPDSRTTFDHSFSCQDVLNQILKELKVSIMEKNRVLNGNGEGGNQ
ncbi:hypothetical protein PTKIN_Ptkin09bG0172500 [Pterospermum kingtungense]